VLMMTYIRLRFLSKASWIKRWRHSGTVLLTEVHASVAP
jgi:hypothetical protein